MKTSPNSILLEICTASLDDVLIAQDGGADRVELNSALPLGGLTPSAGTVRQVMRQTTVPVIAMARPRESGFCYSNLEFATLRDDVRFLLDEGVHGVAFGVLDENGQVDRQRCCEIIDLIGPKRASVFHRAFDLIRDQKTALQTLMDCGVQRVMTSGGKSTAMAGRTDIADLVRLAGRSIEIIGAGGIRIDHVKELLRETGLTQVHAGLGNWESDRSYPERDAVNFYNQPPLDPAQFRRSSADLVEEMAKHLNG